MNNAARPAPARRLRVAVRRPTGDAAVWAMVAVFSVIRFLSVATSGPTPYPDTHTYRVKGSFLDFSLSSLDGRSVRPWGATVWLALWPGDEAIVLAQAALAIVAWATLALTVAAGIRHPAVRRGAALALLLLACTPEIANWDLTILGESVSISSGILALAALLQFTRAPSWRRGVVFLLAALWFCMTRPNLLLTLLAWAVALLVIAALQRRHVLVSAVVAGLLVVISLYGFVYNVRSDDGWRDRFGFSRTVVAYAYPVSRSNPVAKDVIADLRGSDAPRCMIPANPDDVSHNGTTAWVARTVKTCPGMDAWATDHWASWWGHWLLTHPRHAARIVKTELPASLSPPVWANVYAATPTAVSSVFFGSPALPQAAVPTRTYRVEPLLLWAAAAAALALLGRGRRRGSSWACELALVASIVGTLATAISSGLLIQSQALEVGRESVAATAVLTASFVALVGLGLDRLLVPAVADEPHEDDEPDEPDRDEPDRDEPDDEPDDDEANSPHGPTEARGPSA